MSGAVDVQLGDLWRYDERHDVPSMVGQVRRIAALPNGKLVGVDDKGEVRLSDLSFLVAHARLISRAGQPVMAEHDRSACPGWCGKRYDAAGVPFHFIDPVPMFVVGDLTFFLDAEPVWCSARCRDLRLPPMGNAVAAKEAADAVVGKILDLVDASMSAEAAVRKSAPVKHPAGITCKRCLVTSEHGDQHLETCTARNFAPSDRNLTSAQWTSRVTARLELREARRQYAARPFVPDISDEELFGRPVR